MDNNKDIFIVIHIIGTLLALVIFLTVPVVSLGGWGLGAANGFDIISHGKNGFFYTLPFFVSFFSLFSKEKPKLARIASSCFMFTPIIHIYLETKNWFKLEEGGVIYLIICAGMLVSAIIGSDTKKGSDENYKEKSKNDDADTDYSKEDSMTQELSDTRMEEIINNPELYDSKVVKKCKHTLQVHKEAEALMPVMKVKTDEELEKILMEQHLYNEAVIYCCDQIYAQRVARQEEMEREKLARAEEAERKRREEQIENQEREKEEKKRKRNENINNFWKKWKIYIFLMIIVCIAGSVYGYFHSDSYYFSQGMNYKNANEAENAIHSFARMSNPNSSHYSEGKFQLFVLLQILERYNEAAEALKQSVQNGKWEFPEAYYQYVTYCEDGDSLLNIKQNLIEAASLLQKSPEQNDQIHAAVLLYKTKSYYEARKIFEKYPNDSYSYGYLGMMYMYGQGGLKHNLKEAYRLLGKAPDANPFLVSKGDLELVVGKNISGWRYPNLKEAHEYYQMAFYTGENNKAVEYRYTIIDNILNAKNKHAKNRLYGTGRVVWHSYTFKVDNTFGEYSGEYYRANINSNGNAQGWGMFNYKSKDLYMGYYRNTKLSGLGIMFIPAGPEGFQIQVGTFKNGNLVSGSIIEPNGTEKVK